MPRRVQNPVLENKHSQRSRSELGRAFCSGVRDWDRAIGSNAPRSCVHFCRTQTLDLQSLHRLGFGRLYHLDNHPARKKPSIPARSRCWWSRTTLHPVLHCNHAPSRTTPSMSAAAQKWRCRVCIRPLDTIMRLHRVCSVSRFGGAALRPVRGEAKQRNGVLEILERDSLPEHSTCPTSGLQPSPCAASGSGLVAMMVAEAIIVETWATN